MRLWRHVQDDGLALEEVLPGAVIDGILFLEFDCPGCDEFHSVTCDCGADHVEFFFCVCVPDSCPSCGHLIHSVAPGSYKAPILLEEPTYR